MAGIDAARVVPSRPEQIAMVLGLDLSKVSRDGFTVEPFGDAWLVRWQGAAVLDARAAEILFAVPDDAGREARP